MLLREVEYARPSSLEEALRILGSNDGARALAGGQTLINVMKSRAASPDVLVDLAGLSELTSVSTGAGGLEVGAMVTYTQLASSSEVEVTRPILGEVAATIADVQVRNRGTIGGNICSNDPTNHLPPLLVALDARMTVVGPGGERTVSADDFFLGVYMTAVATGELLTKVTVPPPGGAGDGFAALTIGTDGTCIVSAAASVADGSARIAIGCVSGTPVRATEMEEKLGGDFGEGSVREAAKGLGAQLDPPGDVHGSADYRRHLAEVMAVRAVLQAAGSARSWMEPTTSKTISVEINGELYEREVDARRLLVHFIRDDVDLTGTHIGCDTGNCGACTVQLDGQAIKSCMMLAVQADGASIRTVEGLAADGELNALQQSFSDHHALQCGYCTPGMLMSASHLLEQNPHPTEEEIRKALQGNICRCTGYVNIVEAVKAVGEGRS